MEHAPAPQGNTRQESVITAVLLTGLIVSLLDGAAAIIHAYARSGIAPDKLFRYIASALLGSDAYNGGAGIILFGIFLHFLIALTWSAVFFILYPRFWFLRGNKLITGCLYGIFVWLMMNFVVLPLTRVPPLKFSTSGVITGVLIYMFIIGCTIVGLTAYWNRRGAATPDAP